MVTENVLTAIDVADNLVQEQTTQLPPRDVKNLLDIWFKELNKPSDPSQTTRSDQNRNLSQKDQKLLERLKGKENLSAQDKKQLEQLQENLSPENQKLIEKLLKVKEPLSAQDKKQIEQLLKGTENSSQPKELQHLEGVQEYFVLLNEALTQINEDLAQIKESKSHPPHLEKSYIQKLEKLWSINNPYGFTETLETAVDAILHFENKITPKKRFLLYYFHRQQLQQAARKKLFSTGKQIGRVSV